MHDCVTDRVVGGKRAECADCLAADLEKTTKAWALAADERDKRGEELKAALLQIDDLKKQRDDGYNAHNRKCQEVHELQAQIADLRHAVEIRDRNTGEMTFQLKDANRLIDEARKKADAAWRLYDHSEECPVSQDTEDDERKANCECSTGEIEAILDILNKNEKRVASSQKVDGWRPTNACVEDQHRGTECKCCHMLKHCCSHHCCCFWGAEQRADDGKVI